MHALLRVLVLALLSAVRVLAAEKIAAATERAEEALPPIFLTPAEKQAAASKPFNPLVAPARASALSPAMRAVLNARVATLPVAVPSLSLPTASERDALVMDKFVVIAPRERRSPVHRDDTPLVRYLKTGKLYEKIYPDGRSLDITFNVLPFVSRALNPQQSTRFEIALHYKW